MYEHAVEEVARLFLHARGHGAVECVTVMITSDAAAPEKVPATSVGTMPEEVLRMMRVADHLIDGRPARLGLAAGGLAVNDAVAPSKWALMPRTSQRT